MRPTIKYLIGSLIKHVDNNIYSHEPNDPNDISLLREFTRRIKDLMEGDADGSTCRVARLTAERDQAIQLLAEWCAAVDVKGTGWDDWDQQYKAAFFKETDPPSLRDLLDRAITEATDRRKDRDQPPSETGKSQISITPWDGRNRISTTVETGRLTISGGQQMGATVLPASGLVLKSPHDNYAESLGYDQARSVQTLATAHDQGAGCCRLKDGSLYDIARLLEGRGVDLRPINCYRYATERLFKGERVLLRVEMPGGPGGIVGPLTTDLMWVAEILRTAMAKRRQRLMKLWKEKADENGALARCYVESAGPLWIFEPSRAITDQILAAWHDDGRP